MVAATHTNDITPISLGRSYVQYKFILVQLIQLIYHSITPIVR